MRGHVETIFLCATGGAPMQRVEQAEAIAGSGLRGDRYMQRTGYWTDIDECQVTLIPAEALGAARGGICARVVGGGTIRPSDAVVVED